MVLWVFSFAEDTQNSCGKIPNISVMRAVDHEQKILYRWSKSTI